MMHLVKLCVGVGSVEELESYRDERFGWYRHAVHPPHLHVHRTRMMPRRRGEIVGTGSIYWVMGGEIRCRQPIVELAAVEDGEGRSYCDILLLPDLVRTLPFPKRPFQGWRYLRPEDAPADLPVGLDDPGQAELAFELSRLGLI